jgi:hypothetical protein
MRSQDSLFNRLALGAASGFVGTLAMLGLRVANQKAAPRTMPPIREDPGVFMVNRAKSALPRQVRERVPGSAEAAASRGLGAGYGLAFGALYGLARPQGGPVVRDGVALGLACWATGYLGWLPATGLMPPIWEQEPAQVVLPIVQHAIFGMATVATYNAIRRRSERRKPYAYQTFRPAGTVLASSRA